MRGKVSLLRWELNLKSKSKIIELALGRMLKSSRNSLLVFLELKMSFNSYKFSIKMKLSLFS